MIYLLVATFVWLFQCVCVYFCFWLVSPKHSEDKHLLFELFTPELFDFFSPEKNSESETWTFWTFELLFFFHLQFISLLKGKNSKVQKVQKKVLEIFFSGGKKPKSSRKDPLLKHDSLFPCHPLDLFQLCVWGFVFSLLSSPKKNLKGINFFHPTCLIFFQKNHSHSY